MRLAKNGKGKEITVQNLSDIFVKQQEKGAHNINLVTPTMYVYQIIEAIKLARKTGLKIPIIYNSNGYENVETIKMLNGYIDVYLPDLKYYTNELSKKYSNVDNYFEVATNAIKEMYSQVGNAVFDDNGIIQKGVIIRHLVLPNHIQNTKNILKWINENLPKDIYVSVKNKNKDKIDVNYSLFDEGKYSSGDVVGYVSVSLNGNVIRKENIYVKKEEVKEYVSWWTKFLRWLGW